MEQEILQKLEGIEKKIEENTKITRQLRQYFLWTMIISLLVVVLPLIGLLFLIPRFIGIYSGLGV
jgi:type II secretory pathway component PulF